MALYLSRNRNEILRNAIQKVENKSSLNSVGTGSILRAIIESITSEIGNMYDAMDFNISQSVISTAMGMSLDVIGELYGVTRKQITNTNLISDADSAFFFYLESPYGSDIIIPLGTQVYSGTGGLIGSTFRYETTKDATIPAGELYAYVGIRPLFSDSTFTAGARTLVMHNFIPPTGAVLRCKNNRTIAAKMGYESDSNYRLRILKAARVANSGTVEAVRFKALSYEGVRDVRVIQKPYGMGSFQLIVIPEVTSQGTAIINKILPEVQKVVPVGTTMLMKLPSTIPLDLTVQLVVSTSLTQTAKASIAAKARAIVNRYLNNLSPGDILVYNNLIALVGGASSHITDLQITSFAINGTEMGRKNYAPKIDKQIVPGSIKISV